MRSVFPPTRSFSFKHVVMLISSLTILAMGITSASAEEPNDQFVRLSFSDGRADISGLDAVNEQLLRVGVRIFENSDSAGGAAIDRKLQTSSIESVGA